MPSTVAETWRSICMRVSDMVESTRIHMGVYGSVELLSNLVLEAGWSMSRSVSGVQNSTEVLAYGMVSVI